MMETWNVSRFLRDKLRRRSCPVGRSSQSSSSSRGVQSLFWKRLLVFNSISLGEASNRREIFSTRKGGSNYRAVEFEMATKRREEPAKQRYQANARERDRTHRWSSFQETKSSLCSVNTAYSALRTLIPTEPADRKLSKIETLRLASSYISHLDAVLIAGPIDQPCLRVEESNVAAYRQNREDYWGETTQHSRPQVCTFCLAMHKKYNFNVASQMISSDCEKVNGPSFLMIPANGTSYFDVNGI